MSTVLSAGNRADVSGNDMMQFWEDDPNTSACGLYLESIGNPRKFSRISRRLSRSKPVIVAKSDSMGLRLPPCHGVRTTQAPAGALDAMLFKIAEFYEQEVNNAVDALASLLEPFIMIIIGVIVGGMVIGMYLPIFKLGAVVG